MGVGSYPAIRGEVCFKHDWFSNLFMCNKPSPNLEANYKNFFSLAALQVGGAQLSLFLSLPVFLMVAFRWQLELGPLEAPLGWKF